MVVAFDEKKFTVAVGVYKLVDTRCGYHIVELFVAFDGKESILDVVIDAFVDPAVGDELLVAFDG